MTTQNKAKRTQQDRDYEKYSTLRGMIFGHWTTVKKMRLTFAEHLLGVKGLAERMDYAGKAKLPRFYREKLDAFEDGLYTMNAWEKVWVHTHDGRAYLSWDTLPEAGREAIRTSKGGRDGYSVHVWAGPEVFDGALVETLSLWGELKK